MESPNAAGSFPSSLPAAQVISLLRGTAPLAGTFSALDDLGG